MARTEHLALPWLAALLIAGCTAASGDRAQDTSALRGDTLRAEATADATAPNRVLDAAQWADPQVREAYTLAKKYAYVLERIYCYCHCKENMGHRALVECYESDHASQCDICMNE